MKLVYLVSIQNQGKKTVHFPYRRNEDIISLHLVYRRDQGI